jgi:hypothetical protein
MDNERKLAEKHTSLLRDTIALRRQSVEKLKRVLETDSLELYRDILQLIIQEEERRIEFAETDLEFEELELNRRHGKNSHPGGNENTKISQNMIREAIASAIDDLGIPGTEVHWKAFCARVWTKCGVPAGASGYSERTIRRTAAMVIQSSPPKNTAY